jgi:NAD(P)-dependent dehydrogenase (short-subunit alcohol dehydrogenase family)
MTDSNVVTSSVDCGALQNRVILVTGAGDGLGKAGAIAAAKAGATVVLVGKTVKKLEAVYDEIEAAGAPQPAIYPINFIGATWADHFELIASIDKNFGRLDGLVHCAAHFPGFAPLMDEKPKDWMDGLQVNLTAAYALTRHAIPLLLKSPDATVVFVTDACGSKPKAFHGAYGIAKAAIEAMAKTWSLELAKETNLRVTSFDPGPMRTALRKKGYPGENFGELESPDQGAAKLLLHLVRGAK